MTLNEMKRRWPAVYAVIDGCGDSAEIGLYNRNSDDSAEDDVLEWPDDWPSWVTVKFIQEQGLEVITA